MTKSFKEAIRLFTHYYQMFFQVWRRRGFSKAVEATLEVIRPSGDSVVTELFCRTRSDFLPNLEDLPVQRSDTFLMLITDTQIEQCLTYRIRQKMRILTKLGVQSRFFRPHEEARILSYLPLASKVIIYRCSLREGMLEMIKQSGAQMIYEIDDMTLGRELLEHSGIQQALSDKDYKSLLIESERLLGTAVKCDELIVSTSTLAEYCLSSGSVTCAQPGSVHVLGNYLETPPFDSQESTVYDFAYTSPSKSVGPELGMIEAFISNLEVPGDKPLSLLVVGNEDAFIRFESLRLSWLETYFQEFLPFERYLEILRRTRYVLIPVSNIPFNRCKTAIRAMDALVGGAMPIVSPVGENNFLDDCVHTKSRYVVKGNDWAGYGKDFLLDEDSRLTALAEARDAARRCFGETHYLGKYREIFGL